MPREMLPDGTYREMSWEEVRERGGEEAVRDLQTPPIPPSEMTEGQRALAERMQSEAELNHKLDEAGLTFGDLVPGFDANRRRQAEEAAAAERSAAAEGSVGETDEDGQ